MTNTDREELVKIVDNIEAYGFECEGGSLANCKPWLELKRRLASSERNRADTLVRAGIRPSDPSSTRSDRWVCAARQRGVTLAPQDCDWPVCGCDPLASKVLDTIAESGFIIVPKDGASMTDDQIKHMVDRFLMWQLPENFNPDAGISYTRPNWPESWPGPVGTNLFDAVQATAMVRHMLEGFPSTASLQGEDAVERVARIKSLLASFHRNSCYPEAMTGELNDAAARILSTGLVPDEAAVRAELADAQQEAADSLRVLDAIADYVGCPHDEELTVDHVRQHYMKLENAAQRQGVEDAGRIANAQAYSAEREAAVRADEREKCARVAENLRFAILPDQMNKWELAEAQRRTIAAAIRSGGGE